MKTILKIIKLISVSLFFLSLLITNCDLVKTYSEDQYLTLGEEDNDSNKKDKKPESIPVIPGSSEIQVVVEDYSYIINNSDTFSFDNNIIASERTSQIVFRIYNNGTEDLTLTGTPKIEISDANHFTVNQNLTSSTISPNEGWTAFSITFTSSALDGTLKQAIITIPNNNPDNSSYTFTVTCTSKTTGIKEFKNTGTSSWNAPAYIHIATITLVGGGGGGASGAYGGASGGEGGHSGEIKNEILYNVQYNDSFSVTVGNGGNGGSNSGGGGNPGDQGEQTIVYYNGIILSQANGGQGGIGTVYTFNGNGESGESGYNNAPGGQGGNCGGSVEGTPGGNGTINSGAGGGGGGGGGSYTIADDTYYTSGGSGGSGGSGYCRIEWVGFLIP